MKTSRRKFIKGISLGAAGVTAGAGLLPVHAFGMGTQQENSRVSLTTGSERRQVAYDAVKIFEEDITAAVEGKQIILKPNLVWHDPSACATHPDTLRGLLDFFEEITDQEIQIAEASASNLGTWHNYDQYGYLPLEDEYNARLVDLNQGEWVEKEGFQSIYDGVQTVKIVKPFLDPGNWIMSVSRMKSHWHMVATLSVKNVLMAAPWNGTREDGMNQFEKVKMHGNRWNERNNEFLTQNMAIMAQDVWPDFGFVDGFEGMEGNGPEQGTPVDHRIAVAGPDAIAVDRIAVELMGINPHYMRYVRECADIGRGNFDCASIDVIGEDPEDHLRQYQLADGIEEQIGWLGEAPPAVCEYNHYTSGIRRNGRVEKRSRTIRVDLPHSMNTHMAIYAPQGRKVRQLVSHTLHTGRTPVSWDGLDDSGAHVPPGVYLLQLRTGAGMVVQKMTVPK
jgi:uncharacterized protein (DUF362 family)